MHETSESTNERWISMMHAAHLFPLPPIFTTNCTLLSFHVILFRDAPLHLRGHCTPLLFFIKLHAKHLTWTWACHVESVWEPSTWQKHFPKSQLLAYQAFRCESFIYICHTCQFSSHTCWSSKKVCRPINYVPGISFTSSQWPVRDLEGALNP